VQAAHGAGLGGQGDIHRLGSVAGSKLCLLYGLGGGIIVCLHLLFQFVDDLAHGGALFRRNGAQVLHQGRDLAVFAEVLLPERSQCFLAGHLTKAFSGLLGQLVDHCLHGCSLLYLFVFLSGGKQKSPVPCPAEGQTKGDEALKNSAPRYHPVSARAQVPGSSQNAVTGRNRPALIGAAVRTGRSGANFSTGTAGSPFSR